VGAGAGAGNAADADSGGNLGDETAEDTGGNLGDETAAAYAGFEAASARSDGGTTTGGGAGPDTRTVCTAAFEIAGGVRAAGFWAGGVVAAVLAGGVVATGAEVAVVAALAAVAVGVIGWPQAPQNRAPSSIWTEQCGHWGIGGSPSRKRDP